MIDARKSFSTDQKLFQTWINNDFKINKQKIKKLRDFLKYFSTGQKISQRVNMAQKYEKSSGTGNKRRIFF